MEVNKDIHQLVEQNKMLIEMLSSMHNDMITLKGEMKGLEEQLVPINKALTYKIKEINTVNEEEAIGAKFRARLLMKKG